MEPYVVPAARPDRRRWWWAAAWVGLVAVIAGGAVAVADRATTPEEQLAEVIAFVREHRTARFETVTELRFDAADVWEDIRVLDDVQRASSAGELDVARGIHTRTEEDGSTFEMIELPDAWFSRIDGGRWSYYPNDDTTADPTAFLEALLEEQDDDDAQSGGYLFGSPSTGARPDELLVDAGKVGELIADGRGRLRLVYRLRDLLDPRDQALVDRVRDRGAVEHFLAPRSLVIEHGDDGRLDAIREEAARSSSVTTYARWGDPVSIEAPPADQVDRTPTVDEEALTVVDPGPMVVPTDLPGGWQLLSASVVPGADEDEECRFASVSYGPGPISEPTASVALVDPACRWLEDQVGDLATGEPVHWGPYDAYRHDGDTLSWYSDIWEGDVVGAAVHLPQGWLLVTTTEGEDVLARLVASLAPYEPASAATPSATVKAPS